MHSIYSIIKQDYTTSSDPRGYLPVFQYNTSNSNTIMWDRDDYWVNWSSIRKALGIGKHKSVKQRDTAFEEVDAVLSNCIEVRRVRGGILKIQGVWVPFHKAKWGAEQVGWKIREELVPLFGKSFLESVKEPAVRSEPPKTKKKRPTTASSKSSTSPSAITQPSISPTFSISTTATSTRSSASPTRTNPYTIPHRSHASTSKSARRTRQAAGTLGINEMKSERDEWRVLLGRDVKHMRRFRVSSDGSGYDSPTTELDPCESNHEFSSDDEMEIDEDDHVHGTEEAKAAAILRDMSSHFLAQTRPKRMWKQ